VFARGRAYVCTCARLYVCIVSRDVCMCVGVFICVSMCADVCKFVHVLGCTRTYMLVWGGEERIRDRFRQHMLEESIAAMPMCICIYCL
jgi:hypothetical protein